MVQEGKSDFKLVPTPPMSFEEKIVAEKQIIGYPVS
jgi:hypothetical protein